MPYYLFLDRAFSEEPEASEVLQRECYMVTMQINSSTCVEASHTIVH